MYRLIIVVGAASVALTSPAFAKPDKGHGNHGQGHSAKGYSANGKGLWRLDTHGGCPPGLAKKHNGCLTPGQAKKLYHVGQRYNRYSGNAWSYDQIPWELRNRYDFDRSNRYYYNQGYLYQVDPKTMLVQQVISALLR